MTLYPTSSSISPTGSSDPQDEDDFFRVSIDTFDTSSYRTYSQEYYDPSLLLDHKDYEFLTLIQQGASGKVYHGRNKQNMKNVALKVFGYSPNFPDVRHVYYEIQVMSQFANIAGVVQLLGYFPDTSEGILSNRLSPEPFPIIVMELLEGGEVFHKIYKDKVVECERDIAILFYRIVVAVQSIHENKYIHRDIKLENLMFLDLYENSPVKIVDMGSMVSLSQSPDGVYRDCGLVGTPGYIAPESAQYFDYSYASDIWQLGCCLYSMLSGHSPFGSDLHTSRYLPMSGVAWNGISADAKDLVKRMLQKSITSRITISGILSHPWLINDKKLSTCLLSEDYYRRMKYLALRQKMKNFFLDTKVIQSNRDRRKKLKKLIPLLSQSSSLSSYHSQLSSAFFPDSDAPGDLIPSPPTLPQLKSSFSTPCPPSPSIFIKRYSSIDSPELLTRKSREHPRPTQKIIEQLRQQTFNHTPMKTISSEELETGLESFRSAVLESFSLNCCEYISYDNFRGLLVKSELSDLANRRVFNIFDLNKTGLIDMKDFLLTMAALNFGKSSRKSASSQLSPASDSPCGGGRVIPGGGGSEGNLNDSTHSLAQLYFSIFDISGRGYIELDQMKTAIDYILYHDDEELGLRKMDHISPRRSRDEIFDVEMLFAMIDTDGDGKIDFEKFSFFFNKLRSSTI